MIFSKVENFHLSWYIPHFHLVFNWIIKKLSTDILIMSVNKNGYYTAMEIYLMVILSLCKQ